MKIDDKFRNQIAVLQHDIKKNCKKYDPEIALLTLFLAWNDLFYDLFSEKIEVEKILEEYLKYQDKACKENIYNTGDWTSPFLRENELLKKVEILKNIVPNDESHFKNKISVKEKYPEYPYGSKNYPLPDGVVVPGNYILVTTGPNEEDIKWVHPSTLLNKKYD